MNLLIRLLVCQAVVAISYFLSNKYGFFYQCMRMLCQDERFIKYSKAFSDGLMNLDFFNEIAKNEFPLILTQPVKSLLIKIILLS